MGYDTRMVQKFVTVAAWALLAFISYATVSPINDRPTLHTSISLEHMAAFAVIGLLFCLTYPRHVALVCLIVFGSAVLLEFVQLLTPDRHGRLQDAIEKISGGVVGIVAGRAFVNFDRASRRFHD
jgi:VanZ family protein